MTGAIGFIFLFIVLFLYFFPTTIAAWRNQKNTTSIFILNLFLAWTFIGWVIALVWAVKKD